MKQYRAPFADIEGSFAEIHRGLFCGVKTEFILEELAVNDIQVVGC